ncbi:MAG: phosphoglycerate dehydrogenase [Chloroflexi bacterium]|nr:phosphoglycerate dehydrogenase [Chloroflexota bacterium]
MRVLITDPIANDGIELLQRHADVDVRLGVSQEELIALIPHYEALIVRSETKVTEAVIAAGRRLQVIGRAGVGVDNIDLNAATRHGIVVVNAPTGNTFSAAELTIGLMFSLARHIPQAHGLLKQGQWRRQEFMGVELRHKVLGLVGLGRVGTEVARRAVGLEMRVIAYDPFVTEVHARSLGVEVVPLDRLLAESDFISVHTPLSEGTRGLIGEPELRLVKPSVRILNVARGGIVEEEALYRAVEEGRVAGAAVDVFTREPVNPDNPLLKTNKIVVTPHLGASTEEAQTNVAVDVAEQVVAVLQGQAARYAVNAPLIPAESMSFIAPFVQVCQTLGLLARQLVTGQPKALQVRYEGEIAHYDTTPLKAAILGGMLEAITEERITVVNAHLVAQSRGLVVREHKGPISDENYSNLVTVEVETSTGPVVVAGTQMRGEPHIVRIDGYWLDIIPTGGYLLLCENRDRPGMIGRVGTLLGDADINIAFMQVGRDQPRGKALMVLGLDEPVDEEHRQQILQIPNIYTATQVKV